MTLKCLTLQDQEPGRAVDGDLTWSLIMKFKMQIGIFADFEMVLTPMSDEYVLVKRCNKKKVREINNHNSRDGAVNPLQKQSHGSIWLAPGNSTSLKLHS